jgi:UDP-N-acetylmuramate--alanine ligase
MVVEADESDGTFNRLPATIAIVTNIDPEHMEHWGTIENLRRASPTSCRTSRSTASPCSAPTIPRCRRSSGRITDRRVVTFGFNAQADVRAVNLRYEAGGAFRHRAPAGGRW